MIDIQQLTSLISAFRVETEKESISPETVGSILQAIADLLATATSETEYNIIRFWKETLQQYRFLYDIQQRNVDDHSNVILQLMARSMVDGATSSLTLAIGPATRTRAGVLTAEDYIRIQGIGETNDAVKAVGRNGNRDWHLMTHDDTRSSAHLFVYSAKHLQTREKREDFFLFFLLSASAHLFVYSIIYK